VKINAPRIARRILLPIAALLGVLILATTTSMLPEGHSGRLLVRSAGIAAIVMCILGRTWAALYIGGRKAEQFVTEGPYSITRNPLYSFSILGAAGVGAQSGSVLAALIFGMTTCLLFYVLVRHEEQRLLDLYGAAFLAYKASVPRFVPKPGRWRDSPTIVVAPSIAIRTFAHASTLLLAVPLGQAFEHLQTVGVLPVLARLP
jgi:protein-S-isoprenylcysteine O-methyltransferase Ste14